MFYDRTDALLDALNRILVDKFGKLKVQLRNTENSYEKSELIENLYEELYDIAVNSYLSLAQGVYSDEIGINPLKRAKRPDLKWIDKILSTPDPVSKYIFDAELDRRAARLFEAVSISSTPDADIDAAMRSMALSYAIYAVRVTDDAAVKAMKDSGVKKVRWVAEDDTHTCKVCHKRDDTVYPIDDIPPKPHINCRCWLVRVP